MLPDLPLGSAPGTATGYETAPSYSSVSSSTSYDSGPAPPSIYDYPPEQSECTQYVLCGTLKFVYIVVSSYHNTAIM